jgi:glutaredoxin
MEPSATGYTIFTKSGCYFCARVKDLLEEEKDVQYINCDTYLLEPASKAEFLKKIAEYAGREYKTFPMVFYNGVFMGGFSDVEEHYEKKKAFSMTTDF